MHGAPMGMLALLFGFTAEAIGVVAGAACVKRFKKVRNVGRFDLLMIYSFETMLQNF